MAYTLKVIMPALVSTSIDDHPLADQWIHGRQRIQSRQRKQYVSPGASKPATCQRALKTSHRGALQNRPL
jgi:hypothetical protein